MLPPRTFIQRGGIFTTDFEAYGDALRDETFIEKVGALPVKNLSRAAKDRRPGSIGYAEAMLLAYNRKCRNPLQWNKLYGTAGNAQKDETAESQPDTTERLSI